MSKLYHTSSLLTHPLRKTVDEWNDNKLFASRMHIIEDAFDAHCKGTYTLSIPSLFPLIEGVLNEYVHSNNLNAKFGKINQIYEAVIGDPDGHDYSTWAIANTLLYLLQTNTYDYTSFTSELDKSIHSRRTTRHTVLHGVAVSYHKPVNSLKIFLTLDALSALNAIDYEEAA